MTRCDRCKIKYPTHLIQPFRTHVGVIGFVCGICALELSNELHSTKRDKFDGEGAERARLEAIKFREQREKNIARNKPKSDA